MQAYTDASAEDDEEFDRAKLRVTAAARAFIRAVDAARDVPVSCRLRRSGLWECRALIRGRRRSFYARSHEEAAAKAGEALGHVGEED